MPKELEQIKEWLVQTGEAIKKNGNFLEIEKTDVSKIENPSEAEKTIEFLYEIGSLSASLNKQFTSIQEEASSLRIKAEKHLELLNKKALQKEEPFFILAQILFTHTTLYNFFHNFRIFLAQFRQNFPVNINLIFFQPVYEPAVR